VAFSPPELSFYKQIEAETQKELKSLQESEAGGSSQYVNMLYLLLRLRQACNHPWLVRGAGMHYREKAKAPSAAELTAVRRLSADTRAALLTALRGHSSQCPACSDVPEDPSVTRCGHVYCQQCVAAQLEGSGGAEGEFLCLQCNAMVRGVDVYRGAAVEMDAGSGAGAAGAGGAGPSNASSTSSNVNGKWSSSSKVDKLLALLDSIRQRNRLAADQGRRSSDGSGQRNPLVAKSKSEARMASQFRRAASPGLASAANSSGVRPEKAIVFSQWTSMLDLLEIPLKKGHYHYRRLDGTMTVAQRERAIEEFEKKDDVLVLVVSLKAAALGLNLTVANHVVLLDLWWNPTTEEQAIDRAHRIGQTRTVHVTRLTVPGTVEERILELQVSHCAPFALPVQVGGWGGCLRLTQ
jgi:SNF2 family DNA or RNA helicase